MQPALRLTALLLIGARAVSAQAAAEPAWTILVPSTARSQNGATLTIEADGTTIADGQNPETDTFTLDAPFDLRGVTGFRLEVFEDASHRAGGPGRSTSGNFVLSSFTVAASPKSSSSKPAPVALARALASWSQAGYSVLGTLDAEPKSGWGIFPRAGRPHTAVFEAAKPVDLESAGFFRFVLDCSWGDRHVLGRFRLSVTSAPRPLPTPRSDSDPGWPKLQGRISGAIDRGVRYLLSQQLLDGGWREHSDVYPGGSTALALYALVKSGVPVQHAAIRRAIEFLRAHRPDRTYSTSCLVMALCAADPKAHQKWIQECVDLLVGWQRAGFSYPQGAVDLSNTQYGALALRTAARHGITVPPKVWLGLIDETLRHQEKTKSAYDPAGFRYAGANDPATSSMTAAGLAILGICEEQLRVQRQDVVVAKKAAISWLARHFSPNSNTVPGRKADDHWIIYMLYGVERAAGIIGIDRFGEHDWYREGATWLLGVQGDDGAFRPPSDQPEVNTAFTLLFLSKATSSTTGAQAGGPGKFGEDDPAAELSLRAAGDNPMSMWVSRIGDAVRTHYEGLDDKGKGLRIRKVDYFAGRKNAPLAMIPLGTIPGDPSRPHGNEAFALSRPLPSPGLWLIQARASVLVPGGNPSDEGSWHDIESRPLEVHAYDVANEALIAAAGDAARNLINAAALPVFQSSTEQDSGWAPALAGDGLQARGWLCKDGDPEPWISVTLGRPVRASTILFTPTRHPGDRARKTQIRRVAVTINDAAPPTILTVDPDDAAKTVISFPKPAMIKSIKIQILDRTPGSSLTHPVGIAEIEAQFSPPQAR